jgi:ParB family chromosome partitioning protein
MLLAIETIRDNPANARAIGAPAAADEALRASMRTIGLLQPILVAADPFRSDAVRGDPIWEVRAGHRRLQAAKALGWTEIAACEIEPPPGMDSDAIPETAVSAAENMVRAAMHPVDQWRAIGDLCTACGYNLETAAAALGVPLALARRMQWLGGMIPAMLDAIGAGDLPESTTLRVIAQAPGEVQEAALQHLRPGDAYSWRKVAEACTVKRIPRARALFDVTLMAWDEDLFAEVNAPDQFTTADVAAFLTHQHAAMAAKVAKSKGRYAINDGGEDQYGRPKLPKGWRQEWGTIPKRFAKDDERRVFLTLVEDGYQIGTVAEILASPVVKAAGGGASADGLPSAAAPERPAISKKVQAHLAAMKADAVRERLDAALADPAVGAMEMLAALLLCFTFNNVRTGVALDARRLIGRRMVGGDGDIRAGVTEHDLCVLAASVIGAVIAFDAPDARDTSGPGAEWLARAIDAQMPRTDTQEVLAGIKGDVLAGIAKDHRIDSHGTVGALRKRLTGQLSGWRAAAFGAPGPVAGSSPIDDGEADDGQAGEDWQPGTAEAAE